MIVVVDVTDRGANGRWQTSHTTPVKPTEMEEASAAHRPTRSLHVARFRLLPLGKPREGKKGEGKVPATAHGGG